MLPTTSMFVQSECDLFKFRMKMGLSAVVPYVPSPASTLSAVGKGRFYMTAPVGPEDLFIDVIEGDIPNYVSDELAAIVKRLGQ